MKYAFLLAAYKTEYLQEALSSIISQSFQEFEVLVSDDCSPNHIKEIVDHFHDARVRFRRNEHNIGARWLVDHWNILLEMTDAEFVIMASDDDVYHKDFLQAIDALQNKYPDVDLMRARIQHINEDGEVIWKERPLDEYQNPLEAVCECPDTCVPNYVFRRSKLLGMGGFVDFPYAMGSDTVTAMAMSMNGVANTTQVLFSYRLSESQISCHRQDSKIVKKEKLFGLLDVYDHCIRIVDEMEYPDKPINHQLVENYKNRITNSLPHLTIKYVSGLGIIQVWKVFGMLSKRGCFKRIIHKVVFLCSVIK